MAREYSCRIFPAQKCPCDGQLIEIEESVDGMRVVVLRCDKCGALWDPPAKV